MSGDWELGEGDGEREEKMSPIKASEPHFHKMKIRGMRERSCSKLKEVSHSSLNFSIPVSTILAPAKISSSILPQFLVRASSSA